MTTRIISLLYLNKGTPIPMKELASRCELPERVLRKHIEQIRNENLIEGYVLISSDKGYSLSNDSDEINAFLRRYLGMAFSQIKTAQNAKAFLSANQVGQIKLDLTF